MTDKQKEFLKIDTSSSSSIKESIVQIAKEIITGKALKINGSIYSFIDVEFYFWHDLHQDGFAKTVNHDRGVGELEMHRYGIDISLGDIRDLGFGGILIRGLYDIAANEVVQKSAVTKTIFNKLVQGENNINIIDRKSERWEDIFATHRMHLGDGEKDFKEAQYRFLPKNKEIFKSYNGKEAIFKNSNLTGEEVKSLLGYALK